MPAEDVYKLSLFYHTSQRQMIATHYYEAGPAVTNDPFEEAEALASAWLVNFPALYQGVLSSGCSLGCIKVEQVKGAGIPTFVSFFSDLKGTRFIDPLPANMSVMIRRRGVFLAKARTSLLFLGGVAEADTNGSFLDAGFVSTQMFPLLQEYNEQLTASAAFQLAEFGPVMPHTPMVYARDIPVLADLSSNTLTLQDGTTWSERGFISGPKFSIAAPSKNKGTYFADVVALNPGIALTQNELEFVGPENVDCQQVTGNTSYFTLFSAVVQTAVRQLNRRRSSHTGIVA